MALDDQDTPAAKAARALAMERQRSTFYHEVIILTQSSSFLIQSPSFLIQNPSF